MILRPYQIRERFDRICEFISSQIAEIEADSRYKDKAALIQVNAPLALIQVEMKAKLAVLKALQKMAEERRESDSRAPTG
jgi:hypothetical protein